MSNRIISLFINSPLSPNHLVYNVNGYFYYNPATGNYIGLDQESVIASTSFIDLSSQ